MRPLSFQISTKDQNRLSAYMPLFVFICLALSCCWIVITFAQLQYYRCYQHNKIVMVILRKTWHKKLNQHKPPISWQALVTRTDLINNQIRHYQWLGAWCNSWFCVPGHQPIWQHFEWARQIKQDQSKVILQLSALSPQQLKQFQRWLEHVKLLQRVHMAEMHKSQQDSTPVFQAELLGIVPKHEVRR